MGRQMGFQTLQLLSIVVLCFRIEKEEEEREGRRRKKKKEKEEEEKEGRARKLSKGEILLVSFWEGQEFFFFFPSWNWMLCKGEGKNSKPWL